MSQVDIDFDYEGAFFDNRTSIDKETILSYLFENEATAENELAPLANSDKVDVPDKITINLIRVEEDPEDEEMALITLSTNDMTVGTQFGDELAPRFNRTPVEDYTSYRVRYE